MGPRGKQCHSPTSYKIDFKLKQAIRDKDKDPVKEGSNQGDT